MTPTERQMDRANAAQARLLTGDEDDWQAACTTEQQAARDWINGRVAAGKAPIAIAFGALVEIGFLLRALTGEGAAGKMIGLARRTLDDAILRGPDA